MRYVTSIVVVLLAVLCTVRANPDFIRHDEPMCQKYLVASSSPMNVNNTGPMQPPLDTWQAIILLLSLGALFTFLSISHRLIRSYIFYDGHLLDTFFDAGGDVNFALLATVIVANWTVSGTFSFSADSTALYGVAGQFWYAAGTSVQLLLFAMVACEVRVKAPGAKTYLQVIHARFGTGAHIIIMIFAFITLLIASGLVITAGSQMMSALVNGLSFEVIVVIVSIIVAIYTVIGGLGGLIFSGYIACATIFGIALYFFIQFVYQPNLPEDNFGSVEKVFNVVSCLNSALPSEEHSMLTFLSVDSLTYGVIIILTSLSVFFTDQSFWQCSMAAKPSQSVWGFLVAGISYFALPLSFGYVLGFGYWGLNVEMGNITLSSQDVMMGYISLVVPQYVLPDQIGGFLMFTLIMTAVVTTLANKILGATSIIIYDIYHTYISPFRTPLANAHDQVQNLQRTEDYLRHDRRSTVIKHVTVIAASVLLIPVALVIKATQVDMMWLLLALAVVVGSCVLPVTLSITWHRITRGGFIAGCLGGLICGVIAWLVYASMYPGGLGMFMQNTGEPNVALTGLIVSVGMGGLLCIIISLPCGGCDPTLSEEEQWEYTRLIDNPILPWQVKYAAEMGANSYKGRPHYYAVRRAFHKAEVVAYVIGVLLSLGLILIWPAFMLTADVFTLDTFQSWTTMIVVWTGIAAALLVVVSAAIEIFMVCRQAYYNRDWKRHERTNPSVSTPYTLSTVGVAGRSKPKHHETSSGSTVRHRSHSVTHTSTNIQPAPTIIQGGGHTRTRSDSYLNVQQSSTIPPHMEINRASFGEAVVPTTYVTRTDILRTADYSNRDATLPMNVIRDTSYGQPSTNPGYSSGYGGEQAGPWKTFIRLE